MQAPPFELPLFLALVGGLAAQARPLPHPLEPSRAFREAVVAGTRTTTGRPGPRHWTDVAHYEIRAELSPHDARLRGSAKLTYHNRSPVELDSLYAHARQNLHAPAAVRNVVVEVTGGCELERWQQDGKDVLTRLDGTVVEVLLQQPLASGAKTTLSVDFAFTVPDGEAPRMGREGHDLYFLGYWYPQFAVHDDVRGWVAEPYLGESEFYMPWADYDVAFTVPEGWLVQATGTLQNAAEVLPEAALQALATAATSATTVAIVTAEDLAAGTTTRTSAAGTHTWRFQATNVRDFAIATANCWRWDAVAADVGDRDGDGTADRCLVQTFYRPRATSWRNACRYAQHAIARLSSQVLPYPWPHATVVEGILGGGMEYPMLVLCGDQRAPFPLQSLIAHELAHMWFPMQVGNDETAHGWQDEGLADFYTAWLEQDFWKQQRPSAARRDYLSVAGEGLDREPLLRHADHLQHAESYVFVCYTKPTAVLQQLAHLVGQDRLLAALRDYATAWRYRHPMPEDFFASLDKSLGQDLGWYWSTWWAETWTLDHAIATVRATGDGKGSEVVVEDRGLAPHPALVRVRFADGSHAEQTGPVGTWLAGARSAGLTFAGRVDEALLDPAEHTLDVVRENNRWARE